VTDTAASTTSAEEDSGESGEGSTDAGVEDTAGSSSEGPPPECIGSHPLVEGELRYCEEGSCYCNDTVSPVPSENCFTMDIADPCCAVELVCY
jgi:hypothetical protein